MKQIYFLYNFKLCAISSITKTMAKVIKQSIITLSSLRCYRYFDDYG